MLWYFIISIKSKSYYFKSGPWKTVHDDSAEHQLESNTTLGLFPELGKEWRVSFEFRPTSYNLTAVTNLLQLTTGASGDEHGGSTPMIEFEQGGMVVTSSTESSPSYRIRLETPPAPNIKEWTKIEVDQRQEGCSYFLAVSLANKEVIRRENPKPRMFSNVTVFASNPDNEAQPGSIKNLSIRTSIGETLAT